MLDITYMKEDRLLDNIKTIKNLKSMIDEKNSNSMTALERAFERKYYNIADYLLKNGAIMDSTDAKYIWYHPPKTEEDIIINNNMIKLIKRDPSYNKYNQ